MSLPNSGSVRPYGAWWMNRRTSSHRPLSPKAISSPRMTAAARMSKSPGQRRRLNPARLRPWPLRGPERSRSSARMPPEPEAATLTRTGARTSRSPREARSRRRRRLRRAWLSPRTPSRRRRIADRREPRPVDHEAAMRASAKRRTTMAIGAPMRLKGMLPPGRRSRPDTDSRRGFGKHQELAPSANRRQTRAVLRAAIAGPKTNLARSRFFGQAGLGYCTCQRAQAILKQPIYL